MTVSSLASDELFQTIDMVCIFIQFSSRTQASTRCYNKNSMKDDFKPFRPEPALVPVPIDTDGPQQIDTPEPPFVPPSDIHDELPPPEQPPMPHEPPKPRKKKWYKRLNPKTWSRQQIIITSALVGLVIACGLIWWFVVRAEPPPPPPPVVQKIETPPPAPTTVPSRLTGVQVKPELDALPTTGVMIENSPDARPQSGLFEAGVVFEAIAEGGITRFLALYQEAQPKSIGPVRSIRPYYLDFLAPFDAPIAHAGGSGNALARIRREKFKDLEAFQNPTFYTRVSSRYAPHNLYTSRAKMLALQKAKGWSKSTFTGFARKEEKKPEGVPPVTKIAFTLSGFLYNPKFTYDPATNSYRRSQAGRSHIDEKANQVIRPKVVIAMVMPHRYSGIYSVYNILGSGKAFVFQDGTVTVGKWTKNGTKAQIKFTDANGNVIALNPGQTWVTAVARSSGVVYKP